MFLRRKKLLLILIIVGIAWAAIASFTGHNKHPKVVPDKVRGKAMPHQPEFYYESADEVIEVDDEAARNALKAHRTYSRTTFRNSVDLEQMEQGADVINREQELEELEGDELEIARRPTPAQSNYRRTRVISVSDVPNRYVKEQVFAGATTGSAITFRKKTFIKRNKNGNSPGHNGSAVLIEQDQLNPTEKVQHDVGWQMYAHNEYVSRRIPLRRVLPDVRDPECKLIQYNELLLDVSVILTFHNEAWTTLLRAVYSIIDRSPPQMLSEVILFDDGSTAEHLKQQLDDYVLLLPKVRLVRSKEQLGVISARQEGSALASGSILVFLDSHVECAPGWLEPLVDVVTKNHSTVAIPIMDIIDDTTFQYKSFDAKSANIGGFDWNLQFVWTGIPDRERKRQESFIDPIKSPTMSGGMYAITKKWFEHLGGYDTGMDMWGAENLEMSFRTWMCGGSIEVVPCSHVGHVFRKRSLYHQSNTNSNPRKNFMRLAEIWMDEFKSHFYDKIGGRPTAENAFGDLTDRKQLRTNLKCQSFKWYLNNVFPELFIPEDAIAVGEIKSSVNAQFTDDAPQPGCLDSVVGNAAFNNPIKIWPCHGQGGNQYWLLSASGEIRRDDGCFDYAGKNVVIYPCHGQGGNQQWQYTPNGLVRHIGTKRCLELSSEGNELLMMPCSLSKRQVWHWNQKRLDKGTIKDAEEGKIYFEDMNNNVVGAKRKNLPVQELAGDEY